MKLFKNKLASLAISILYLFHPLQTEAVSYVAGRADPMHSAFLLLSFWFFVSHVLDKNNLKYYICSLVFFIAALLTKERAIVWPAIFAVYFFTVYPEPILKNWKRKLKIIMPFFLITLVYLILRLTVLHFTNTFDLGQPNNIGAENIGQKMLLYLKGISIYAGLIFWPAKLYMEKTLPVPTSIFDPYVLAGIFLIILSLVLIYYSYKKEKVVAFGLLWFWLSFFPSFYVYPIQGILYEHWLYFPLIGVLIFLLMPLSDYLFRKNSDIYNFIAILFLIGFLIGFGARTIIRNNDWQNPITFYEKNVELGGYSARIYTNLGMAYDQTGRNEEAIEAYKKAIQMNDQIWPAWYDMGNTYALLKESDQAKVAWQKSIEINPTFISAYNNLAKLHLNQGKFDEAIKVLKEANKLSPNNMQVLHNLGIAYYQKGDKIQARKYLKESLDLQPTNIELIKLINNL